MPAAVDSVATLTPTLAPAAGLVLAAGELLAPEGAPPVVVLGPPTMATPLLITVTLNWVEFLQV